MIRIWIRIGLGIWIRIELRIRIRIGLRIWIRIGLRTWIYIELRICICIGFKRLRYRYIAFFFLYSTVFIFFLRTVRVKIDVACCNRIWPPLSCLEEDFHQMLDEWDNQLGSLQTSDLDTLLLTAANNTASAVVGSHSGDEEAAADVIKTGLAEDDLKPDVFLTATPTATTSIPLSAPTTICVRRPVSTASSVGGGRGLVAASMGRQLPVSSASALRSPVISRGICYTRTGGLGVTR